MFKNIKNSYEAYKAKVRENKKARWVKFKSKLPENVQTALDKFEVWYAKYKETAICEIVETVVFVVVMVILIRFFVGEIRWIPSGSMKPTLIEGDRIVVERFSRFFSGPQRGDIMVFYPPSTELSRKPLPLLARLTGIMCKDIAYIKRVVGLPGDKVEIKFKKNGVAYVYINDKKYEEDYIKSVYEYTKCPKDEITPEMWANEDTIKCGPFYLDEDSYFMMGDNRGDSRDSRYWGPLKRERFVGRAVTIFFPFNRARVLHHLGKTNVD
jgi:signal peptidase I